MEAMMNRFARIVETASYLPEDEMTNNELVKIFPEWNVEKISAKTGVNSRHIAGSNETALDLCINAAEKLFLSKKIEREAIDYVLFCTESPDYILPPNACIAQDRLELRTNVGAFDINLGCSGFVYGVSLAKAIISSGQAEQVLLLTGDTYSKYLHPEDKSVRTIFGDAGTATLIELDHELDNTNSFVFHTDGKGKDSLMLAGSANRKSAPPQSNKDGYLHMAGADIFLFTLREVPKLVKNCLEKAQLDHDDIDYFLFHQANAYMLENLRKKCGIEENKFIIDMDDVGNTVSSSIPIALERAILAGTIKTGHRVLIAGFGVGLSCAAGIITI